MVHGHLGRGVAAPGPPLSGQRLKPPRQFDVVQRGRARAQAHPLREPPVQRPRYPGRNRDRAIRLRHLGRHTTAHVSMPLPANAPSPLGLEPLPAKKRGHEDLARYACLPLVHQRRPPATRGLPLCDTRPGQRSLPERRVGVGGRYQVRPGGSCRCRKRPPRTCPGSARPTVSRLYPSRSPPSCTWRVCSPFTATHSIAS